MSEFNHSAGSFSGAENGPYDTRKTWDDMMRDTIRQTIEKHKVKIEVSKKGPFLAVVLMRELDHHAAVPDSGDFKVEAASDSEPSKKIKFRAWVDIADSFPNSVTSGEISPFDDTDPIKDAGDEYNYHCGKMRHLFTSAKPNAKMPGKHHLVYVDWPNKVGEDPYYWGDGIYLGPVRPTKPIKIPIPERSSAKDAMASHDIPAGTVPMTTQPGATGANLTSNWDESAFSQDSSGMVHGDIPVIGSKFYNVLQAMMKTPPLWLYNPWSQKKEIYVDKKKDYPNLQKLEVIPFSKIYNNKLKNNNFQYRKGKVAFFLPDTIKTKQRKETKMFIIKETGTAYIEPQRDNLYATPTIHYSISMNSKTLGESAALSQEKRGSIDRLCTIRVNVPFGLIVNEKNAFSTKAISCAVSSPVDGDCFLNLDSKWDRSQLRYNIESSTEFKNFKNQFNGWIEDKTLPDGNRPYILGPWGTPGLRTGPAPDQKSSVKNLPNKHFWEGRLAWSRWGHYFLPALDQAAALYDLITNIVENPPRSGYSWGFKTPGRYKHSLTWNFPAVGGGSIMNPVTHFISKELNEHIVDYAFPWGKVNKITSKRNKRPYIWWKKSLESAYKGDNDGTGIVSMSRWADNQSAFLEYYILARQLGLGHLEAWYVTIATAANTFGKAYGGLGLGPTVLPLEKDTNLNNLLAKGQKMWFAAMAHNEEFKKEDYVPGEKWGVSPKIQAGIFDVATQTGTILKKK